ncbi:MAG: hypothetical protein F9K16_02895 [Thermoanaerobaculia bacterium]|nr:MAG: hypothetical protein F9K16_02895 [Thermoanaerobaculia bacterium]MBZ0100650.1 hypothetical protein [Thermoanaerobaculia bacterium]
MIGRSALWSAVWIALQLPGVAPALADVRAVERSPGAESLAAAPELPDGCPVLRWEPGAEGRASELVVLELPPDGGLDEAVEVRRHRAAAGRGTWALRRFQCLTPGRAYAWRVRGVDREETAAEDDGSPPLYFRVAGAAAPFTGPASPYTVTDLGTLGGPVTKAMGVNDAGDVVGASQTGSYLHGFTWTDGTMTNLGDLGGQGSWAYDVNAVGQVVGGSPLGSGDNRAFLWQNGGMQDLGTLGGPNSYALEINDAGQAVGYACCAPDTYLSHAVLWGSGGIVDLGDLDPLWPAISAAYGLNDAGQVVGGSYDASANFHAFLWQNGGMQDLGTLGGDYSAAEAINEDGQIVGTARLANSTPHAFLWQNGAMQDLGALGWNQSVAYDINDDGMVVGVLQTGPTSHAFLWADGQMQDLNNLIPTGSGWELQEARAISNRGRIAGFGTFGGQTRAFLLEPRSYRWINPAGGAWSTASNWDPQGIPDAGDWALFDLAGQYSIDTTSFAPPPGEAPAVAAAPRGLLVEGTNTTVDFHSLNLNILSDSPADPGLQIGSEGIVNIHSGSGTFVHGALGVLPSTAPNPARLQVFNSGTTLTGTGGLLIGDEGPGDLFVANGGHLTSAEARLGGLLPAGLGTAVVGGDGSLWETGNLAVGYGVQGELTIENGGRVDSNDAYVSWGMLSSDSNVTVAGVGAGTALASHWALLGSLAVGQTDYGWVEVLDGGNLYVTQNVEVRNGELAIDGRHANGDPSEIDVLGSVFVGGPGTQGQFLLLRAARGGIEGDLVLGRDGPGYLELLGASVIAHPTQLDVVDPSAGLCAIGREFYGGVSLDDGGLFRCRTIEVGGAPGTTGNGTLTVDGGMVRALGVLTVGKAGGGLGLVFMLNNALVATNGTYISPYGVINGTGTLAVNFLGLQNDGILSPAIYVLYPLTGDASRSPGQAAAGTATLTVDGALTLGASGRLEIPLAGPLPGEYGSLAVTGAASLDGVLSLEFQSDYAPREGDLFTLLDVAQGVTGDFTGVEIHGLEPGFEFEITIVDGQVVLEALNDGVPEGYIFADGFESGGTSSWSSAVP